MLQGQGSKCLGLETAVWAQGQLPRGKALLSARTSLLGKDATLLIHEATLEDGLEEEAVEKTHR